nr:MAG TPA: tail protein [Bacteriophage sp.]
MGDKNIHLSASLGIGKKPKDGKDGTSVTILSTKVLYQVSASPTDIPTSWVEDIKNAIQTDSKPYLWSKTIVAYSDNNKTVTYSVSYKGKDGTNGTSFTPKGMADGFFNNMSSVPTYADGMDYDVYIVNVDDRSNPTSKLPPYVCRYEYESLVVEHAEFGDGYNVNGYLYVANSDEWVDFGEIQGAKGEQGEPGIDGKDAINIVFSPAELVFDADENGNLIQSEKSANIKVYRGTTELHYKTDWDNDAEIGDNCRAALLVNTTTNKPEVKISGITSSTIDDINVPATSGGANVSVIVDSVKYRAYLPFSVNVNTYANFLIRDNKKYISKYTEVSNKYDAVSSELDNKANKNDMEEKISTISQKADNIKLEVLSKTSGRRNMLVNSAFRNQDSVFIHSMARIEKNTGVDGVNCIHSSDKYSGTGDGNYIGAFWYSTQKNGVVTNIPIVKGKKYVISCWIKSDNLDLPFNIECLYMKSINQQSRDGSKSAKNEAFKVTEKNKWQKISCVLDTNNADATGYLAVNFWSNNKNVPKATGATDYPTCHAYICKPMMEEGDTYSGWTLSEADYDYVGGNILDNTRSLEKSGNLDKEESEIINEGYEYSYAVAHSNNTTTTIIEMLEWNVASCINDEQDYIFSFLAKGTGVVTTYLFKDGTPRYFIEGSNGKYDNMSADGFMEFDITNEWRRYWVHYRMKVSTGHPLPEKLLIRCNGGNDVYICQPKLEIGATMTEFTERKTDLVDKATLKKAGIEITTDQVKLYGDKVQVLTRKDGETEYEQAGMFSNGKLNANLIDADAIEVKHLWAKSEDGTTKVGYFGNTDIADSKVGNKCYPLWLGANKAGDANFRVSENGEIYSIAGTIGGFIISDSALTSKVDGMGLTLKKNTITFDSSDNRSVILGTSQYLSYPYLLSLNDRSTDILPGSAIQIDTKDRSSENNGAKPSFFAAIQVNVRNATRNYAMVGTGNVVLNGFVAGTKYSELVVDKENTNYNGFLDLIENNVWVIKCTAKNSVVFLPKLDKVRVALGYSASSMAKFRCFMCIISNSKSSSSFELRGRRYDDKNYSSHDYPAFLNYDGTEDYWSMSKGDSVCVMLYFDGNDYKAQLLTLSR